MAEDDAVDQFKHGLTLLWSGSPRAALVRFRTAVQMDAYNPFYLSYMGVAMGRAFGQWDAAEDACFQALKMERHNAELYLNMMEVYCQAGKRQDAVWILNHGLGLTRRDLRLQVALLRLGVRRPPLFSFLDRSNFLNRKLGRLRHLLFAGRLQVA